MLVNRFLREVLAEPLGSAAFVDHEGAAVGPVELTTKLPADLLARLPLVYARHVTGSEHNADLRTDFASVAVDVYADSEHVAEEVAEFVRNTFKAAQRSQTVYPSGHIAKYECPVTPFPFPRGDLAGDHDRYTAQYRLLVRPAA